MTTQPISNRAACAYCGEHARPNSMYCMSCGQIVTLPPRATAASRPVAPVSAQLSHTQVLRRQAPHMLPPVPSVPSGAPQPVAQAPAAAPALPPTAPRLSSDEGQAVELVLGSGARTRVHGTAVLGRRPEATARNSGAQAVEIPDDTKSVSRAHAIIERRGRAVEIFDAGSANGSSVERDGAFLDLGGDARISLQHGDRIWLGDVPIEVSIVQGRRGVHA